MNLLYVTVLAMGLALYLFCTISKVGATQPTLSKTKMSLIGIIYSVTQILLVGIGILISYLIEAIFSIDAIVRSTRIIVIGLLILIIYRLIKEAFSGKTFLEKRADEITGKGSVLLALQSSLEAIVVGICVFEMNQNAIADLILVIVFTLLASFFGFWHGYLYGTKGNRGVMGCSAVLLCAAVVILL